MDENKTAETVVEEAVVIEDEKGFGSEVLGYLKKNWWKGLIALATTAGSFAAGVLVGSNTGDIQMDEAKEPEPPFEMGEEL